MAEKRIQVAYHFKVDPAQLVPGAIRIPEQIIRTVAIGDDFTTDKVSSACLSPEDHQALLAGIEKQVVDATRTARPADAAPIAEATTNDEEMSAF